MLNDLFLENSEEGFFKVYLFCQNEINDLSKLGVVTNLQQYI